MIARRTLLALVAATLPAALAGCGWEPLYGTPATPVGNADLRAITVPPIAERAGQMLEFGLRQSFNPDSLPTKPRYMLRVTLTRTLSNLGIQSQGLGTRGEMQLMAGYTLIETGTNKVLQSGQIHANDSFDIQANGYSTIVAQDDATTRDVEEIRQELVSRMTLFMQSRRVAPS